MTLWESRRLNEQHLSLLNAQRKEEIKNETQLFRLEKQDLLDLAQNDAFHKRDTIRSENTKQREIKRIIKSEQAKELDKNSKMF